MDRQTDESSEVSENDHNLTTLRHRAILISIPIIPELLIYQLWNWVEHLNVL